MTLTTHPPDPSPLADEVADVSPLARIVRNSAFNAAGTLLIVPFNMLALFLLARRLGTQPMGTFVTIFSISAVIHWVADAGTTTVLMRRVSRAPGQLRAIVGEAAGVLLVVCIVSAAMFFLIATPWMAFGRTGISMPLLIVAATAMASRHALEFAANALRGLERFEFENISRVIQTFTFCLFVWLWVYPDNGGALGGFIAFAASNFIAVAFLWGVLIVKWQCTSFTLSRAVVRQWWTEAIPMGAGDVVRQLLMHIDVLLLFVFRPLSRVGLYGMAARPLQPLQMLPRIIVSVTFPGFSRAAHLNRSAISRMFARTTNLLWSASLPISIGISMCATPLIVATAGPAFAEAAGPLQILIWGTGLLFINAQLRFVLTALDAEQRYWRLICYAFVAKLLLEIALIPIWGMYGAAWGNLLGEGVLCVAGLYTLHRLDVAAPPVSQLLRVMPAAAAMALVLWPFSGADARLIPMLLAGVVSGIVYVIVCLVTGVWPWSDVMRIWGAITNKTAPAVDEAVAG
ncbi:MAG TPA: oligosaccharide flippase family protein [Lacipirellula sp.]